MGLGGGYIASVGANKVTADKHDVALSMCEFRARAQRDVVLEDASL